MVLGDMLLGENAICSGAARRCAMEGFADMGIVAMALLVVGSMGVVI